MTKQDLIEKSNKRSSNHFKDYEDYIYYQTKQGLSFEKDHPTWTKGQQKCIEDKFKDLDRNLHILDICCGDGRGLIKFKEMGFKNILGVEICDDKIEFAKEYADVKKMDVCSGPFDFDKKFDIIYSSHTIEHVLSPEYTMSNLKKYLNHDGIFFLILPYPDVMASSPHNDHNFKVHCGSIPLGLHVSDEGKTCCSIIEQMGFEVVEYEFHSYRESEIHLTLKNKDIEV